MKIKALFLDRDGVINIDKKYVYKIEDFEFCEGIFELCRYFLAKDYLLFIVTNQSGIARGYYKESDFFKLCDYMLEEFVKQNIRIDKIYHCPHLEGCECRKPKAGMLLKAKDEFNIDMKNSIFIGDNLSDMQAGLNADIGTLILVNGEKKEDNFFRQFKNLKEILSFFKQKENQ
ncbi:TPA: HAD family hydrolase [Campylobacter jejuni]|nr:HAD family hydrolase [Campylobacter jejuni]HDZ5084516.1 HAD family hydrolase [Campylobacter jejuni]HDZ5085136.1 HAD family hydrolase [Campylobacter jejuni]HDZ5086897.1 HAD family hydrolase [Campylobacter jejuni]HDZ5089962.1 HAD family hydrolase [Campylobacter jejuni]